MAARRTQPNPETHFPNGARRPTTPEQATPRTGLTPAQVQAQQRPTETLDRAGNRRQVVARSPAAPLPAAPAVQSQMLTGEYSDAAFDRNLLAMGGASNPILQPNLSEGDFRTTGQEVVDVADIPFI